MNTVYNYTSTVINTIRIVKLKGANRDLTKEKHQYIVIMAGKV